MTKASEHIIALDPEEIDLEHVLLIAHKLQVDSQTRVHDSPSFGNDERDKLIGFMAASTLTLAKLVEVLATKLKDKP